jgi:hypothetical protein
MADVTGLRCRVAAKRGLMSVPTLAETSPEMRLAMLLHKWGGVLARLAQDD